MPWTGTLTTTKVGGQTVLAEPFLTGIGCVKFPASGVGVVGLLAGLSQITWNGRPLYLFSHEELAPLPNGGGAPPGNGNGIKAFGGTFSLVVNP